MKYQKEVLIFCFYFLLAVVFTYPLIFRLNTSIYGYPGDNFSTIWHLWWAKYAIANDLARRYTPFLNAPFGLDLGVTLNSAVLYSYPLIGLSFIFNELIAFNLVNFVSFPLAAFTMYLLVRHLTKNSWAAVLSGLIFSFSPYHFWKAYNHADLASIQWLPLYVLSLIKLSETKSYRWSFLAALSFAVVTLTAFYYGYFMILFTAAFFVLSLFLDRQAIDVKSWLLTGVLATLFLLPFTYNLFLLTASSEVFEAAGRSGGVLKTTTDELLALSSRPWDFVLPSEHHPVFGKYTSRFCGWLAQRSGGFETQCTHYSWERNIYLGWVGLLLSLVALGNFRTNRKWILLFTFLAILMVWISFPAFMNIKGHRLYFPSYFLHRFAPMFRTYVRLGVVVLLCVAVLAGFGFTFLLEKVRSRRGKILLTIFTFFILNFDFLNIPPFRYTDLSQTPPVYQWLAEQPGDFIIAEYPKPYSEAEAMFFQRIHQKRMIAVNEELANIYTPQVVEKLGDLGVKYVVVHVKNIFPSDPYNGNREYQVMSPPMETDQFKMFAQFPKAIVYEVL